MMNRREFLIATAAASTFAVLGKPAFAAESFNMGAQSYSFRQFPLREAIAQLKAAGLSQMEFCGVHFPADASDPKFEEAQAAIQESGIAVPCYGVEELTADEAYNRKKFEFAKALGIAVLTANPTADSFDNLDKLTEEYGIKVAIHNHGPGARYDKVADTLAAVEGHSPMIGACLDTGHSIRSDEKPHEVIEQLGDRLISMHLKDWTRGGEEQVVGEGDLDLVKCIQALHALNFSGPIMLEYENHPDNPAPHMKQGLANWNAAAKEAQIA